MYVSHLTLVISLGNKSFASESKFHYTIVQTSSNEAAQGRAKFYLRSEGKHKIEKSMPSNARHYLAVCSTIMLFNGQSSHILKYYEFLL